MTDPRPLILGLIGGSPINQVRSVILEKFPAAKSLNAGPIGSLLSSFISNPASVLQNPMAAASSALNTTVGNAVSQITTALGSGPAASILSALTGGTSLSSSLTSLVSHTNLLTGITASAEGQFSPLDLGTHANFVNSMGSSLPTALGIDKVLAPILSAPQLTSMVTQVASIATAVSTGAISVATGTSAVNALASSLDTLRTSSVTALQGARDASMAVGTLSAIAALATAAPIKSPSTPAEDKVRAVMRMVVQPAALVALDRAVATHVEVAK